MEKGDHSIPFFIAYQIVLWRNSRCLLVRLDDPEQFTGAM